MIKRIEIEVIPHYSQRYNSVGDWQLEGDILRVRASECGDWRKSILWALHEAREGVICTYRGITDKEVDDYDFGDKKGVCPYANEHEFSIAIEKLEALQLGIDWPDHEKAIDILEAEWKAIT